MDAGQLQHRITIEQFSYDQDSFNSPTNKTWTTVATVWGKINPLQGREVFSAQKVFEETSHTVTIRYRAGITANHRLVARGRIFQILGSINQGEDDQWLVIFCTEWKDDGN